MSAPMLVFRNIAKRFGRVQALSGLDLRVEGGGLTVLLGPGGAGKTTALRLAAGLETPDGGGIAVAGEDMAGLPPRARPLSMVFDNLALYPDRTAAENMVHPLRIAGWPAARIGERLDRLAVLLHITHTLNRLPRTLSGGERQRVALGRAMALGRPLMLLDEPLSSLDAQLRLELRAELRRLQAEEGRTVLMATPDQVEALAIADEVVVLLDGRLQQSGVPQEVYDRPVNRAVARLVGAPAMNLLPAELAAGEGGRIRLCGTVVGLPPHLAGAPDRASGLAEIGVRPEHVRAVAPGTGHLEARFLDAEPLGPSSALRCAAGNHEVIVLSSPGDAARHVPGDRVGLQLDMARLHPFGADGARLA